MTTHLHFTLDASHTIKSIVARYQPASVVVIADTTVATKVAPRLNLPTDWSVISFPAGEENKNITHASKLWEHLIAEGATRHSLVINLGGGVVTDMGGWVASTFKRGIDFINIPTTLLCAVDAAVGGKTAINFCGLKNEIGTFAPAKDVVVDATLFSTLSPEQMISGYGEMLKHSFLNSDTMVADTINLDILDTTPAQLNSVIEQNIRIKQSIVDSDPTESGPRKALNLGHTFGHAIESYFLQKGITVAHGIAVMHGLLFALILSHIERSLPSSYIHMVAETIKRLGALLPEIKCNDYPELISLMRHDKKNTSHHHINFTLLTSPGEPVINNTIDPESLSPVFDIYRDLTT